jgi:alkylated DNA repair dioxygenase AlkB
MALAYETPIRTETSELRLYDLELEWCTKLAELAPQLDLDYHPEVVVYGKVCHQQRSIGFYSDTSIGYRYSGQLAKSRPMTPELRELLEYINNKFDADYNGILVNKYETGNEYIGQHSDDEANLNPTTGVVAISVGAIRKFRICKKGSAKKEYDIPTNPTKIMQMWGQFQREFTHGVPVEKKVRDCRYSFTFRKHTI